jgi:hypothetical protein
MALWHQDSQMLANAAMHHGASLIQQQSFPEQ